MDFQKLLLKAKAPPNGRASLLYNFKLQLFNFYIPEPNIAVVIL